MAFYSSILLYRPRKPPAMTSNDLATFISKLSARGLLQDQGLRSVKAKFGAAIDQDDKETIWYDPPDSMVSTVREIEWDLALTEVADTDEIARMLASDKRRIYRAHISLGTAIEALSRPITRVRTVENKADFSPCEISLNVGPVMSHSLQSNVLFVGWISIVLFGVRLPSSMDTSGRAKADSRGSGADFTPRGMSRNVARPTGTSKLKCNQDA